MKRQRGGSPVGGVQDKRAYPTEDEAVDARAKPSLSAATTTSTSAAPATQNVKLPRSTSKYHYAVICSSNVNRSMEAHVALMNEKMHVSSFGAGRCVDLVLLMWKEQGVIYTNGNCFFDR